MSTFVRLKRYTAPHGRAVSTVFRIGRFLARSTLQRRLHNEWFALLARPEMEPVIGHAHRIGARLQRDYVSCHLRAAQRFRIVMAHYGIVCAMPAAVRAAIYSEEGHVFAQFEEGGLWHVLRLRHVSWYGREGDVSLQWSCNGSHVASATFSFAHCGGERLLLLGGLQGDSGETAQALFHQLTKSMHGLRPMSAMIQMLQMLARASGATRILAVEDSAHAVYRDGKRNRARRSLQYDRLWEEHGGTAWKLGFHELPLSPLRRPVEDIASNKRSMYRKRYALLDQIDAEVQRGIGWIAAVKPMAPTSLETLAPPLFLPKGALAH